LFYGSPRPPASGEEQYDWWVTPLGGGAAIRTEAFAVLSSQGLSGFDVPGVWVAQGSQVVFSASLGDSTNLWRVPIQPASLKVAGAPERLTYGLGVEAQPSLAAAAPGTGLAFANLTSNADLWSLPVDANQGKPTGQIERLTQDAALDVAPDISPDGHKIAFVSARSGNQDIWIKDLETGRETALTFTPAADWLPVFSPDGSKVAYGVGVPRKKMEIYEIPSGGGVAEKLCDDCGTTYERSRDGKWVIALSQGPPQRLRLLSPASGKSRDFSQPPGYILYRPRLSPDNRWLAISARSGPLQWRLFIVPFRADGTPPGERDWVAITDEDAVYMTCRWSPDGSVIYFSSGRDGSTCIWAQRLDPATKRPAGAPWPVHHAHSARLSMAMAGTLGLNIALPRDVPGARMVFPMTETTGNIWMAEWK
jgi:Tol biopolymer transport system component